MQFDVRGRRYNFRFVTRLGRTKVGAKYLPVLGLCDPPDKQRKHIRVVRGMEPKQELEIVLHELNHACFWDLDEAAITEAAMSQADALWKLGWRKIGIPE